MKDLEHYLGLDWRFREVKSLVSGPHRDAIIGDFWRFVYRVYYTSEVDLLRARAMVLAEYIGALDEERSTQASGSGSCVSSSCVSGCPPTQVRSRHPV
jgi:hypothetical protein